jgi:site-specific recombinase XerD
MNMTSAIIEYRRHLKRRNFSSHTLINYISSIKLFVLWLEIPVQAVTHHHIGAYIDHLLKKRMHPQSINSNLYRIRGFYDFLHYEKELPIKNPVKERCNLRLPKPLPKYLRDTDIEKLFSVIKKKRDLAMFKIMLRCGLRLEETANLTKDALDLERQQLIVYNGKGKKDRVAYISNDAKAALMQYLKQRSSSRIKKIFLVEKGTYKGRPISVHGIKKRMEYYTHKSCVKASCHHLRHTMATQMLNADGDLVTIQTLLGHSRITTTERYSKVHNAKARRDYFKAMCLITDKSQHASEFKDGYRNFFNRERRQQVSKNFGMADIEA